MLNRNFVNSVCLYLGSGSLDIFGRPSCGNVIPTASFLVDFGLKLGMPGIPTGSFAVNFELKVGTLTILTTSLPMHFGLKVGMI